MRAPLAIDITLTTVQAMLASMRMTTDTYQAVLPEMHAATASVSLYPITTYRAAEGQKAGKKMKKKDLKADGRRPAGPRSGPPGRLRAQSASGLDQKSIK